MKTMNYKIIALTVSGVFLLSGCSTIQEASSAMGSTGTGVLAGVIAGAGAGVACDKLTGGKNTGACVAVGMAVGAAVGTWAADMDEAAEKAVPAMDCKSIKKRMVYSSTASLPRAELKLASDHPSLVVSPGQSLKLPIKMNLATPGKAGQEQDVAFKIVTTSGSDTYTGKVITKECGGDYSLPATFPTDKEGVYNTEIKLVDANDSKKIIDGSLLHICYTVASNGVSKCPAF
ncbi:MAG: hypothetical protein D4R63_05160 [Methylococcaceae bacterium]|nr:MAG: hypothetical protein D4R63_05160 [Methylococcaceae bacterium]